jgi:GcrA cell cycle regulator
MHPDLITTSIWDDPKNVETLAAMWIEGASAGEIATALGQGVTRNAVIGKVTRLKLPPHRQNHTVRAVRPEQHGNKGHPQARTIVARAEGRQRSAALANVQHSRSVPFRPGSLPREDGVDFTGRIGFASRRIGHQCAWIFGEPSDGAVCCGKPVKPGTEWCPDHWAKIYKKAGQADA